MKYLTKIAGTEQLSYEFKGKHVYRTITSTQSFEGAKGTGATSREEDNALDSRPVSTLSVGGYDLLGSISMTPALVLEKTYSDRITNAICFISKSPNC